MQTSTPNKSLQPKWWTDQHTSSWDRVKEAMRRDWEQTKADFSKNKGQKLEQNVGDTIKQAVGKEEIPPPHVANPKGDDWGSIEPAMRFGYGSHSYYSSAHPRWDDKLETKLKDDWNSLKSGRTWDDVKTHVKRGFESVTKSNKN